MMVTASTTQSTKNAGKETTPNSKHIAAFLGPARRRGERTRGEHRGQHAAGRESERGEQPTHDAEYVPPVVTRPCRAPSRALIVPSTASLSPLNSPLP